MGAMFDRWMDEAIKPLVLTVDQRGEAPPSWPWNHPSFRPPGQLTTRRASSSAFLASSIITNGPSDRLVSHAIAALSPD